MVQLSPERLELAKVMQAEGVGYETIADRVGCSKYTIKTLLIPCWKERKNMLVRRARSRRTGSYAPQFNSPVGLPDTQSKPVKVPEIVLIERDRRALLEPISLTAAFCGDPLPGRSALDKRKPKLVVAND